VSWLTGRYFSPGPPVSSNKKTDLRKLLYIECSSSMILFLTFQVIDVSRLKYNSSFWRWKRKVKIFIKYCVLAYWSLFFSRSSGFLQQKNWPPRYSWNIGVSGVKHHQRNKTKTQHNMCWTPLTQTNTNNVNKTLNYDIL
jgi:hypothetical protein